MSIIETLAAPWAQLYSNYTIVAMLVMSVHLLALLVGGGLAVSADRATLRARAASSADRERQLDQLAQTHRAVVIALAVSFLSGALLAAADVAVFIASPFFWIKLGIVFVLLANGAVLRRVENQMRFAVVTEQRWARLALLSKLSITLWVGAVIAGVALTDFAG